MEKNVGTGIASPDSKAQRSTVRIDLAPSLGATGALPLERGTAFVRSGGRARAARHRIRALVVDTQRLQEHGDGRAQPELGHQAVVASCRRCRSGRNRSDRRQQQRAPQDERQYRPVPFRVPSLHLGSPLSSFMQVRPIGVDRSRWQRVEHLHPPERRTALDPHFDPDDGKIKWEIRIGGRADPGRVAGTARSGGAAPRWPSRLRGHSGTWRGPRGPPGGCRGT